MRISPRRIRLLSLVTIGLLAPMLMAPNPVEPTGPIGPPTWPLPQGVVTTGYLGDGSEQLEGQEFVARYQLQVEAGKAYSVWLASNDFDCVLYLHNPAGEQVDWDDDSYSGTNSTLTFSPTESGSYQVLAASYSAGAGGGYRILAQEGGGYQPNSDELAAGGVGGSLDGRDSVGLESGWHSDYFELSGAELGEQITLVARSAAFDVVLYLVDSVGRIVMTDDDSAGGNDALLAFPWTPAPDQTFFAVVTSAEPGTYGGYFLQRTDGATVAVVPDTPIGVTPQTGGSQLTLGREVSGRFEASDPSGHRAGHADRFEISLATDTLIQIDASSEDADTYLQLFDGRDLLVGEDDDGGRRTNSRLVEELPAGTYTLEVSAFDGEPGGSYTLTAIEAEWLTDPEEILVGSEERSRWTVRHPRETDSRRVAHYEITPRSDTLVTILLDPSTDDLFCRLELLDRRDRIVETSLRLEDGCVIVTELERRERYHLRAIGERTEDDESFFLAVSDREDSTRWTTIQPNRDVRGHITYTNAFTEWNAPGHGFTLELDAGQRVSINVSNTDIDARAVVIDNRDRTVASSMDSSALSSRSGMTFTATTSGWYRIVILGRQHWFGTFTLRVNVSR